MAHDVFISYPKPDENIAEAIQATLESNDIQCWIATRDIPPGVIWTSDIYDAINNCKLFVLVYSANTNEAQHQLNELQVASNKGKPIFLFRVSDTPLSKEVEFSTSRYHWIDAWRPPLEYHLQRLTEAIQRRLYPDKFVKAVLPKITPIYPPPILISIPTIKPSATKITTNIPQARGRIKSEKPQYGGTLAIRAASLDNISIDPPNYLATRHQYWYESLFERDWTLDRDIWPFTTNFTPAEYFQGLLAESWEQTDPTTITVHLRKGVKWHNKPPVNGREFTAYDVQQHYDRMLGTGSRYDQPSAYYLSRFSLFEKVIAADKYTIVVKFKKPGVTGFAQLADPGIYNLIEAPESVKLAGGLTDWGNAVGTGPWMLKDFISGSSMTLSKNPNYWGYDERHPQNKLPYVQTVIVLAIPDTSTAIAALRTGKIDMLAHTTWQQAKSIAKTNPEILQAQWPAPGSSLELRCDRMPFNDLRVRKALQMSIDREAIARVYYGGTADGMPAGLINPICKGWCIPYVEWPGELRYEYCYNPARARELLAEAGYPNGFITNCVAPINSDLGLLQMISSYFSDIGVDMEIRVKEPAVFMSLVDAGEQDQIILTNSTGSTLSPFTSLYLRQSGNRGNYTYSNDPSYDTLITEIENATSVDRVKQTIAAADIYAIKQHWAVNVCPVTTPVLWQPYLKGYSGELDPGAFDFARWWIDYELKKSMGR